VFATALGHSRSQCHLVKGGGRRHSLVITHTQGGGVQRRVTERAALLRAEGIRPIVLWSVAGRAVPSDLHAVMRGEMRRNLDGSEAGVPDHEARQQAKKPLDERAVRHAKRERQEQEQEQKLAGS
jgi:hypothetical protein